MKIIGIAGSPIVNGIEKIFLTFLSFLITVKTLINGKPSNGARLLKKGELER